MAKGKQVKKKVKSAKGPEPDLLKIDGIWQDAMGKAMKKERPKEGWPEPEKAEKPTKDKE